MGWTNRGTGKITVVWKRPMTSQEQPTETATARNESKGKIGLHFCAMSGVYPHQLPKSTPPPQKVLPPALEPLWLQPPCQRGTSRSAEKTMQNACIGIRFNVSTYQPSSVLFPTCLRPVFIFGSLSYPASACCLAILAFVQRVVLSAPSVTPCPWAHM